MAKPILAKHGVQIERWLLTQDMDGGTFDKPDQIVITSFKDANAKRDFENDPEFKKAAAIRDKAVKLVTITAKSMLGD